MPGDLAGYRNGSLYIRQSMNTPPKHQDALDLMETFLELLTNEVEGITIYPIDLYILI